MKLHRFLPLLVLAICPLLLAAETVKVAVSDTLDLAALEAWHGADSEFLWQQCGSPLAMEKLDAGLVDAAIVLKSGNLSLGDYQAAVLATGGCFLAVHEDNPLKEVSMEQLVLMLQTTREGGRVEWSALLEQPEWALKEVYWSFRMDEQSIGHLLWDHYCFPSGSAWPKRGEMPKALDEKLLGENHLLVLDRLDKLPEGFRFLAVKLGEAGVGFPPTPENLFYEDYPLVAPLLLVVRNEEGAQAWVSALYEKSFGEVLEKSDYSELGEKIKKQSLLVFDKGS